MSRETEGSHSGSSVNRRTRSRMRLSAPMTRGYTRRTGVVAKRRTGVVAKPQSTGPVVEDSDIGSIPHVAYGGLGDPTHGASGSQDNWGSGMAVLMADGRSAPGELMLRDRERERTVLDGLLGDVRAGHSAALVVRGDPGIGKTALLRYAIESASEFRVLRAAGAESELELPFAVVHQLCAPVLDLVERLPGPQRAALQTTFGLSG